uniref:Uncharacterized protein n=1 Tax=Octopus bimaculoides TaxID=37653 RepID=A0A0L8I538_OCTBM
MDYLLRKSQLKLSWSFLLLLLIGICRLPLLGFYRLLLVRFCRLLSNIRQLPSAADTEEVIGCFLSIIYVYVYVDLYVWECVCAQARARVFDCVTFSSRCYYLFHLCLRVHVCVYKNLRVIIF